MTETKFLEMVHINCKDISPNKVFFEKLVSLIHNSCSGVSDSKKNCAQKEKVCIIVEDNTTISTT